MCIGYGGENAEKAWAIDALVPTPAESLAAVFGAHLQGRAASVSAALGWLRCGGARAEFAVELRRRILPTVLEEHQIKHPAAALEEADRAGIWADTLLACALNYGHEPQFAPWDAYDATLAALG